MLVFTTGIKNVQEELDWNKKYAKNINNRQLFEVQVPIKYFLCVPVRQFPAFIFLQYFFIDWVKQKKSYTSMQSLR